MARTDVALTIRPMSPADLDQVLALEQAIYPEPWSAGVFGDELAAVNRVYLVAVADGCVVGYGGLMMVEEDGHITTLAVDPGSRQKRVGTRILLALVERALELGALHLTLEVRVSNLPARELYQRFGFAPVGLRKNYYREEDALVMWAIDIDEPEYRERLGQIREDLR